MDPLNVVLKTEPSETNSISKTKNACVICRESFENVDDLFVHLQEHKKSTCFFCGVVNFSNTDELNDHILQLHKNEKLLCSYCGKQLDDGLHEMLTHIELHGMEKNPFNCTICRRRFKRISNILSHMDEKHHRKFFCLICMEFFVASTQKDNHDKNIHHGNSKSEQFKNIENSSATRCGLCNSIFTNKSSLDAHLMEHIDEVPFECPDCAELFDDLTIFNVHMTTNHADNNCRETDREVDSENDCFQEDYDINNDTNNDDGNELQMCTENVTETPISRITKELTSDGVIMLKVDQPKSIRKPVSLAWQEKDNKIRPFKCDLCNRSFTLATTLALHNRRTHMGIKPYSCKVCKWNFAQSSDLIKHMRKHTGERPYKCSYCGLGFAQNRNLKNHMKMHTDEPVSCKYCHKKFALETSLVQHFKKHESPDAIQCNVCGIPYTLPTDLKNHMRHIHSVVVGETTTAAGLPKEKRHQCEHCAKAFRKSCDLKKHLRIHTGERPYTCQLCGKSFSHTTSLRSHQVVHTGARPFQCSVCGQSFSISGNLKVHMRAHTGERPFVCSICTKSFARTANLNEHMKIHTGEKSFHCDICNKSFVNSSSYSKHKKIHTGERPHQCTMCDKAFIQQAHLRAHTRVHTGEKPFQCQVCHKFYRRADTLQSHMKTHQNKSEDRHSRVGVKILAKDNQSGPKEEEVYQQSTGNISHQIEINLNDGGYIQRQNDVTPLLNFSSGCDGKPSTTFIENSYLISTTSMGDGGGHDNRENNQNNIYVVTQL